MNDIISVMIMNMMNAEDTWHQLPHVSGRTPEAATLEIPGTFFTTVSYNNKSANRF